eukprot:TRINITY_DN8911_c0_g1_i1.p1 TRINITY_DN8911_c0_g1~~TRINITY_DN8911_c0_g1_i1.p1  ORF type:complete len:164 (+),score=13.07 TRINITY_DN8911_c0_g1_i1:364-855(+)
MWDMKKISTCTCSMILTSKKFNEVFKKYNTDHIFWMPSEKERREYPTRKEYRTNAMEGFYADGGGFDVDYSYLAMGWTKFHQLEIIPFGVRDEFWFLSQRNTFLNYYWYHSFDIEFAEFLNVTVPVPSPTVCYLLERYGTNWNTPSRLCSEKWRYNLNEQRFI